MASLADRLKSFTGIQDLDGIESLATTWFDSAAKDVINVLPPQVLYITGESEILLSFEHGGPSNTSTSVPQSRILNVTRKKSTNDVAHECREIDAVKKGYASFNDYMYSATNESPVFYRENNKIFILPLLNVSNNSINGAAEIVYVKYPSVNITEDFISKFPDEIENLVVLKASVYGKFYQIGLANAEEDLEVAASHTNHMSALNQEYTMCLQNYLSGYQLNAKEQGVVNDS